MKDPGRLISDKKSFKGFLSISLWKTCQLKGGAIFSLREKFEQPW